MRKLYSFVAAGALIATTGSSFAFEAVLANNFTLYPHPYSHERTMTLGAGERIDIDRCDHDWCAVTHGPHSGYIHVHHLIDGAEYAAAHGGNQGGYQYDNPADIAAGAVAAPINAGVSFLR